MNTHECDVNIGKELECWHDRLATVTGKIDGLPSIEKYKLTPYIEGLHILLTEMDERIGELRTEGVTTSSSGVVVRPPVVEKEACKSQECERYDYDFGG